MKKKFKSLLCFMLVLSMALSLAACGKGDEPGEKPANDRPAVDNHPQYVYTPEFKTFQGMPEEVEYAEVMGVTDEGMLFTSSVKTGTEIPEGAVLEYEGQYDVYSSVVGIIGFDGKVSMLSGYAPVEKIDSEGRADFTGNSFLLRIMPYAEGEYLCIENQYASWYEGPENIGEDNPEYWNYYMNEENTWLRVLGSEGEEIKRVRLELPEDGYFDSRTAALDNEGNLIFAIGSRIAAYSTDGAEVYSIDAGENYITQIVSVPGDKTYVSYYSDTSEGYAELDFQSKQLVNNQDLPRGAWELYPGGGEYSLCYRNGTYIYGIKPGQEPEKLLNWLDCDINPDSVTFFRLHSDSSITGIISQYEENKTSMELVTLSRKPYDEVPHKEELTMSVMWLDYMVREQVIKFNRSSDSYRIKIKDYSEFNTDEDYTVGETKLLTEIMAGEMPDILSLDGLPYTQLAAKGLIEDIYPYIDADNELKREDLQPNLMKTMEVDGKLCQVVPAFSIITCAGAADVVGTETDWSYQQFYEALEKMPEGCSPLGRSVTREEILNMCLSMDMDSFVDWESGQCSFDTPEFTSLLEFVNKFPKEYNWEQEEYVDSYELIRYKMQMLKPSSIGGFDDIYMNDILFGGNASYVGYPSATGAGSAFVVDRGYAISSSCKNKDAAWSFLREFLTEDYQQFNFGWTLPTNVNALNAKIKDAMTPKFAKGPDGNFLLDENGEKIPEYIGGWYFEDGDEVNFTAMTQEQADTVMEIIENTHRLMGQNKKLNEIILSEAAAYFSGQKSAQDVAKLIQSKVNIYVNEQR